MTNTEKIKEFCKSHDFRHQRDICTEQASEMIMCLSGMGCRYYSMFTSKPAVEVYAWMSVLVDLEIIFTQMAIYCGEESIEKYLYNYDENVQKLQRTMVQNKDDIYILANLGKAISKARRNDHVTDTKKAFEDFRLALYFALDRFINNALDVIRNRELIDYYNRLYTSRIDNVINTFQGGN